MTGNTLPFNIGNGYYNSSKIIFNFKSGQMLYFRWTLITATDVPLRRSHCYLMDVRVPGETKANERFLIVLLPMPVSGFQDAFFLLEGMPFRQLNHQL